MNGSTLRKLIAWIKDGDNAYFNAGDIAIGHNSPTAKLHVKGAGATSDTAALKVENSAGSILLNILNNGKIGVNKLAPVYDMDIVGDLNFTGSLLKNGAAYNPGSQWQNNGSNIYFNSGNVGIGTTNPGTKLHIYGADAAPLRIERNSAANSVIEFKNTANSMYAGVNPSGNFGIGSFMDLTTGYLTVLSTGNVGIGITTPTAKLDINSDILRLRTAKTPATAGASGNAGDICWDSSYFYICVATNTWKRSAIATW